MRPTSELEDGVIQVVHRLHAAGWSGLLRVTTPAGSRKLYVLDGELYVPAAVLALRMSQLADEVAVAVESREPGAWHDPRLRRFLIQIATSLAAWQGENYILEEISASARPPLVGPLPTAYILLEARLRGSDQATLLAALGGPGEELEAVPGSLGLALRLDLGGRETGLLLRLEAAERLGHLLGESSRPADALRCLGRLEAFGLLRAASTAVERESLARSPSENSRIVRLRRLFDRGA